MSEKIIASFTSTKYGVLRVRERGLMESFGSYKIVLERLEGGTFKIFRNGYFKSLGQAEEVLAKLYYFDSLEKRRLRALSKMDYNFEDSLIGTKDHDFFDFMSNFETKDHYIDECNFDIAVCRTNGDFGERQKNDYLRKYNLPSARSFEICDMGQNYFFMLRPYSGPSICLFDTDSYMDHPKFQEYLYLFESKLFTEFPYWTPYSY